MTEIKAEIVKIVTFAHCYEDNLRILSLFHAQRERTGNHRLLHG